MTQAVLRASVLLDITQTHLAQILGLVSGVAAQAALERILEGSKPPLPEACADLHYLLITPFRYSSPIGSRFRAAADGGVWYGAEQQRTACAELGFWRWRFLMDSPALESLGPAPQTVFRAGIDARMVDLTAAPFKRAHAEWTDPSDHTATQRFARWARQAPIDAIRYQSVRDPEHGVAVAVLNPLCFRPRKPVQRSAGFLTVRRGSAIWQGEGETHECDAAPWRESL